MFGYISSLLKILSLRKKTALSVTSFVHPGASIIQVRATATQPGASSIQPEAFFAMVYKGVIIFQPSDFDDTAANPQRKSE